MESTFERVLVTGGAGFIGSHLVERLVSVAKRVAVLDDLSRGRRDWIAGQADLLEVDIRDEGSVMHVVAETAPDAVVHLAAMHFIPAVDGEPDLAWDVNVNGTRGLLDALAQHPPKLLLFASTAAVYPDRRGPIAETCAPRPLDVYGKTKLEGERLVAEFAERTGTRCIYARIFNVIGRRETNPHVVPELIEQVRLGIMPIRLGNLEPRRDYTDVTDIASALHRLLVLPRDAPAIFNVGSGRSVSVADIVGICEQVLGQRIEVHSVPQLQRAHDRAELVANSRLLREITGWTPAR